MRTIHVFLPSFVEIRIAEMTTTMRDIPCRKNQYFGPFRRQYYFIGSLFSQTITLPIFVQIHSVSGKIYAKVRLESLQYHCNDSDFNDSKSLQKGYRLLAD